MSRSATTASCGARERFVDYFESQFLDTQEAVGMAILGQFRVIEEPDRFA